MTNFAAWDAVETSARIRANDVRADEVLEAAIARAEKARHLGAVFEPTYDRARRELRTLPSAAPLFGVPTFIKDLAQVAGVATTWGSAAAGRFVSRKSDPIVDRIAALGVVSLGKSACPELGLTPTAESLGFPVCENPWDPTRTPGGSSGGAAALVAAGVVPIAHGTDGGGSIRIPAACCGLVGLKPSRFRLDVKDGHRLPVNVVCEGVLSRTVRDTVAFFDALESARPPSKVAPIGDVVRAGGGMKPLRLGVFVDAPNGAKVDASVRDAVLSAARVCAGMGHVVEEISCPFAGTLMEDFLRYWGLLAWLQYWLGALLLHRGFERAKLEPWTLGLVAHFAEEKRAAFAATRRLRGFHRTYAAVMERYDVLVSPTLTTPAPKRGYLAPDVPFDVAARRVSDFAAFTPLHNAAGAPALSLPLGRSPEGLPLGVQFAAAHGNDRALLELAFALEEALPWPIDVSRMNRTAGESHRDRRAREEDRERGQR